MEATIEHLATANTELLTASTEALEVVTRQRQEEFEFLRRSSEEAASKWAQIAQAQAQVQVQEQQFESVVQRDLHQVMSNLGLDREDAIGYLKRSVRGSAEG